MPEGYDLVVRIINSSVISKTVAELVETAVHELGADVLAALNAARDRESDGRGRSVLDQILANAELAPAQRIPLCQDTGSQVVYLEIGSEVHVEGETLPDAVAEGIRSGTEEGYLRRSIVADPIFDRANTGDNTPAFLHVEHVEGESVRVAVLPKGGGCENMSTQTMLKPAQGVDGVIQFVMDSVAAGAANSCPPLILGIGVGGSFDTVGWLAKKTLFRPVGQPNPDPQYADLEQRLLTMVNDTGIGPMGWGGKTTALAVHVESHPTHIASLPVAVNFQCHSARVRESFL